MKPFIGTYENKVDQKGRVSVPAKFRAVLQAENYGTIYLRPDPEHGCLEGFATDRLERLSEKTSDILDFSDADATISYQIMAESEELGFDPNGRVLIPTHFLKAADITDTAVFVGLGRVFQVWTPDAFARFKAEKLLRQGGAG